MIDSDKLNNRHNISTDFIILLNFIDLSSTLS